MIHILNWNLFVYIINWNVTEKISVAPVQENSIHLQTEVEDVFNRIRRLLRQSKNYDNKYELHYKKWHIYKQWPEKPRKGYIEEAKRGSTKREEER